MKRYFIVTWRALLYRQVGYAYGNDCFTTDGNYINSQLTKKLVTERCEEPIKDLVVTNIIEVNESDYNDWNKPIPQPHQ